MKGIYKARGFLMAPAVLFALLCPWNETGYEVYIFGLGGLVFCVGWFLRVWAQMHLHYRLKVKKVLTTTGPYMYCRNPIYVGNTLLLVGLAMISELVWFVPVMLVWCMVVYSLTVCYEESHLLEKYGDAYLDYFNRVPRWIPNLGVWQNTALIHKKGFFIDSVFAELHCFLLPLPFLLKELVA